MSVIVAQLTWVSTKLRTMASDEMYPPVGLGTCHFSGTVEPFLTTFNPGLTGWSRPPLRLKVTVTAKLPERLLPCASVAQQPTVVAPGAKVAPDGGVQDTATDPSTTSVAEAA